MILALFLALFPLLYGPEPWYSAKAHLLISGGMLTCLAVADLVWRGVRQDGLNTAPGLPFLLIGIVVEVGAGLGLRRRLAEEGARRAEKKKRRRRKQ